MLKYLSGEKKIGRKRTDPELLNEMTISSGPWPVKLEKAVFQQGASHISNKMCTWF